MIYTNKKLLLIIGLIAIILLALWYAFMYSPKANAWNNSDVCDQGEHIGNPHCVTPTISPTPTDCDHDEAIGDPNEDDNCISPTETLTPTRMPCGLEAINADANCGTPSVSPTATPSSTPTNEPLPPAGHGDGLSDHRSDGRSDGRLSSPQPTLVPCSATTCGWK